MPAEVVFLSQAHITQCQHIHCMYPSNLLQMLHRKLCYIWVPYLVGGLGVVHHNSLGRTVRVSGKVVGKKQTSLEDMYRQRTERKGKNISSDPEHTLLHATNCYLLNA